MLKTALVFPGQGSQRKGMGIDFFDQFREARDIFHEASDTLSFDVEKICREGDPRIDLTEFTQPCLITVEHAMVEVLRKEFGLTADVYGGHSCGEYSALVASGAIPFKTALRLVHIRGKLMQWVSPIGFGGMLALTHAEHELPISEILQIAKSENVDLANDNSPRQVVLSGETKALARVAAKLVAAEDCKDVRVVPLVTSAPFHSRHMLEAETLFQKAIATLAAEFKPEFARNVTSNTTGNFHTSNPPDLTDALTRQISGQVKWRENMCVIADRSKKIFEIGPNRPLSGFFRASGYEVTSIVDVRTALRVFSKSSSQPFCKQHKNTETSGTTHALTH